MEKTFIERFEIPVLTNNYVFVIINKEIKKAIVKEYRVPIYGKINDVLVLDILDNNSNIEKENVSYERSKTYSKINSVFYLKENAEKYLSLLEDSTKGEDDYHQLLKEDELTCTNINSELFRGVTAEVHTERYPISFETNNKIYQGMPSLTSYVCFNYEMNCIEVKYTIISPLTGDIIKSIDI